MKGKPIRWEVEHFWNDGWNPYSLLYAVFDHMPTTIVAGWEFDREFDSEFYFRKRVTYGFRL